jgi:hypothetical protein
MEVAGTQRPPTRQSPRCRRCCFWTYHALPRDGSEGSGNPNIIVIALANTNAAVERSCRNVQTKLQTEQI